MRFVELSPFGNNSVSLFLLEQAVLNHVKLHKLCQNPKNRINFRQIFSIEIEFSPCVFLATNNDRNFTFYIAGAHP